MNLKSDICKVQPHGDFFKQLIEVEWYKLLKKLRCYPKVSMSLLGMWNFKTSGRRFSCSTNSSILSSWDPNDGRTSFMHAVYPENRTLFLAALCLC